MNGQVNWGLNPGTFDAMGSFMGGIGAVGGIWDAWQKNKLMEEQMAMQEKFATANFNNMADDITLGRKNNQQELLGAQAPGSGTYQDMDSYMAENTVAHI